MRPRVTALFGGSFNPPHVAHQLVALYLIETQPVDEVWFVPTHTHPFGKQLAPYDDRVAMCGIAATALGSRVQVSRAEAELAVRPGFVASRTLDLVEALIAEHPQRQFRLVVGSDILGETAKWYRWDDVIARAPLIVIGRTGFPLPAGSAATGVTMPEISATAVRAALAQLTPEQRGALATASADGVAPHVSGLLPAAVLRYIAEHALYLP